MNFDNAEPAEEDGRQRADAPIALAAHVAAKTPVGRLVLVVVAVVVVAGLAIVVAFAAVLTSQSSAAAPGTPVYGVSAFALQDIPGHYLALYQQAGRDYGIDWAVLAGVGKVETDHGRLKAPGVLSGQNAHGCCAGPMQFHNNYGQGGGTWGTYGVDGNHDGQRDIYDPADAIPSAGNYLQASGAPGNYRQAIFAYNHADWYVNDVLRWADRYRGELTGTAGAPPGDTSAGNLAAIQRLPAIDPWLAPVPGFPGERCDRRIIPNLTHLIRKYKLAVTDCHALSGHATDGEHPLGVGVDLVPGPGGSWQLVDQLAALVEPAQNRPRRPFRWVGYNGDPNHGTGNHLHLSWNHAPARPNTQPAWVEVFE